MSESGAESEEVEGEEGEAGLERGREAIRRPTRIDGGVAVGSALLAVVVAGYGSIGGLAIALVGAVVLALGLRSGRRPAVDVAALVALVGVLVAGLEGESVEATLVGTAACVVAWDLGQCAIDLGEQLGREAETARLEVVHVVSTVLLGLVTVTVGYALYVVAGGGQPVAALVLSLLAGALVTIGLSARRSPRSRRAGRH